ncbi:hypothetical protein [Paenibacillus radicis (ex Gao et al. 2016)]|uniref:Uncharacterized protein n=1 Tax=Paenibacillus radicis (ex Gao et al. 2016) TaxID=1737354 RepID=A0A917M5L3_9BACL|nr:hypothetical protein [Paenibacillus radicis (ex Gao et al. 2016)]GGG79513.1 hypothetical protein GCM10010918_40730 [Paenibacillus radicis (ex Gao et al. 2016)]
MEAEDTKMITQEEFATVSELFRKAYPYFVHEIERVEEERGKLNDFQLMLAVSRAKESLAIVNWDYRKMINMVFDGYVDIYKELGRKEADEWAIVTFGCSRYIKRTDGFATVAEEAKQVEYDEESLRILLNELSLQMEAKEAELLHLYEEFNRLQRIAETLKTKPPVSDPPPDGEEAVQQQEEKDDESAKDDH